jgi:glycosyltransferase involved in cell wall biosynthesis
MKIGWYLYHLPADSPVARGFFTTSFHLYTAAKTICEYRGWEFVEIGPRNAHKRHLKKSGLDAVFHFAPPHRFDVDLDWTKNVFFTMWEAPVLPRTEKTSEGLVDIWETLKRADRVVVPSRANQRTFRQAGIEADVVNLGAGEYYHTRDDRNLIRGPGADRIRFLFVGSNDPRKGAGLLTAGWKLAFETNPNSAFVQLYVKMIDSNPETRELKDPYGNGSVLVDTRDLSTKELIELYASADVFLFPSLGEGFGLPPLEAMASGCLVAATDVGGLSEFITPTTAVVIPRNKPFRMRYGTEFEEWVPTPESIALTLRAIVNDWGKPGAEAIRKNGMRKARELTWGKTVKELFGIIEETIKGEKSDGRHETLLGPSEERRGSPSLILST